MRGTFVLRDGELVPKHLAGPLFARGERSYAVPRPMLIRDDQPPLKSMADGRIYESKSAMRRGYRERGYEELGNDAPTSYAAAPEPDPASDVIEAYKMVRDGYKPRPLETDLIPDD